MVGRLLWISLAFSCLLSVTSGDGSQDPPTCPDIHLPPAIPGTCSVTHHCSRVVCALKQDPHSMTIIVQINRCRDPLTAKVSLKQPEYNLDWSHRFRDGEQAPLPVTPGSITGMWASGVTMFLKVKLKKTGGKVNFTLELVGEIKTDPSHTDPVDVTLLEGQLPLLTQGCEKTDIKTDVTEEKAGSSHGNKECPDVDLPPDILATCNITDHCSMLTWVPPAGEGVPRQVYTFRVNRCQQPLTATVTLSSSQLPQGWSHTFKDGEEAKLPIAPPGMPPSQPDGSQVTVFFKVALNKMERGRVKFLLQMVGETKSKGQVQPLNVTFLQGSLPLYTEDCRGEAHHEEHHPAPAEGSYHTHGKCPDVHLPAMIPGTCDVSAHCSKVTCSVTDDEQAGHALTLTLKINKCHGKLAAHVTLKQPASDLDWSHTFEDDEKAKLPAGPGSITGMGASGVQMFLKVGLKKEGSNVHFSLRIVGKLEDDSGQSSAVDAPLLEGDLPLASQKCDSTWFSRQPGYVKALVIAGPLIVAIVWIVITVYCCVKRKNAPSRFTVHWPSRGGSRNKVPMRPLINEA